MRVTSSENFRFAKLLSLEICRSALAYPSIVESVFKFSSAGLASRSEGPEPTTGATMAPVRPREVLVADGGRSRAENGEGQEREVEKSHLQTG